MQEQERGSSGLWLEVTAAIILGLATLASAWGAYQATRWSGVMATSFSEATILSNDAGKAYQLADAKLNLDQTLFVEYAVALDQGEEDTALYIQDNLFSFELAAAMDAWLADEEAGTPFDTDAYVLEELAIGDDLEAAAAAEFEAAEEANQNGDNYVLVTVLFASVLFFAGISSTFRFRRPRMVVVAIAGALFLGAAITMATFPVH